MLNRLTNSKSLIVKIPNLDENFGLTKSEFVKFTQNVQDGDDTLFLTIFNDYFNASIIYLKNKFSITNDQAYDICMDTMLDFRNKLIQGKIAYGNLRYLFTRMAINNFIDSIKKAKKIDNAISVFLGEENELKEDQKAFFIVLDNVIAELDNDTQFFIKELYYSGKDQAQIASENNISYSALRKRKQRIIEKLKGSFFNHLKNNTHNEI